MVGATNRSGESHAGSLFVFTYTYPYGTGESFLETEIEYLVQAGVWRRITVLPARLEGQPRSVPPGVEVEIGLAQVLARAPGVADLLGAVTTDDFRREILGRSSVLASPAHLRRLMGQVMAARRVAYWVEEHLLRSETEGRRPSLCYSYWMSTAAYGLARLKRTRPDLAFVSRAHGYDLYAERHDPAYLPLQREAIRQADAIFTISEHGRSYLASRYADLTKCVEVARLGVLDPGSASRLSTDGRWRVLSCSSISAVKRVVTLVRGIEELARRYPERQIEWDHLGDGPLRPSVEEEARRRLPANVEWRIRGQMPNAAVIAHYRSRPVDVFANVSESEGIPVSIMEAQSFGVPVVATAVGGVPEIVDAGNGVLLDVAAQPAEIADALERVCGKAGMDARLREGSRATWRARYDAAANYTRFARRLGEIRAGREGDAAPYAPVRAPTE